MITPIALLFCATTAAMLARRHPPHARLAATLAALCVLAAGYAGAQWHRAAGLPARLAMGAVAPPYEGWARVTWAAESACALAFWGALTAGVVGALWAREKNRTGGP